MTGSRPRLAAGTMVQARAASLPPYERSSIPNIAHIGVGAFARAHLGVYADDLLRGGWPALIRGVSINSGRAQDQLAPQDGLYTVAECEPETAAPLRVIGALASIETGAAAAIDAVSAPATKLVTLTITEKGYEVTREDLEHPECPVSAPAIVALALARCRQAGSPPPVIASMDNVEANGDVLRHRVVEMARRLDPTLPTWITDEVHFPISVVDRMVPATTTDDLETISSQLGLDDRAAVMAERHRSWIISTAEGLPPLADVGVQVVNDIAPFERRKLWLLNGLHSATAYCGLLAGCVTIASAVEHRIISTFVKEMADQILQVGGFPAALEPGRFAHETVRRFRNPNLGHLCAQVGADGSHKLPQRLMPVVAACREHRLATTSFAVVAAAWIAAVAGIQVQGSKLRRLEDPAARSLRAAAAGGDLHHLSYIAVGRHSDALFVSEVASVLERLIGDGLMVLEERL